MHSVHPALYLQFKDPRFYTYVAVGLLVVGMIVCMLVENSRFGLSLLAIRQNELAAEAAGIDSLRLENARAGGVRCDRRRGRRVLCLRAAGGDAGFGVRHAGLRPGGGGDAVRRHRRLVGAGDRRRHPGASGGIAERRTGQHPAWHPGRGVRRRDHHHHAGRAGGIVLDRARPFLPPSGPTAAAGAGNAAGPARAAAGASRYAVAAG